MKEDTSCETFTGSGPTGRPSTHCGRLCPVEIREQPDGSEHCSTERQKQEDDNQTCERREHGSLTTGWGAGLHQSVSRRPRRNSKEKGEDTVRTKKQLRFQLHRYMCVCVSVVGGAMMACDRLSSRVRGHHMPCLMLWMIWKMAVRHTHRISIDYWRGSAHTQFKSAARSCDSPDPQTTKTKRASSHGPTGDLSSFTGRWKNKQTKMRILHTCSSCLI